MSDTNLNALELLLKSPSKDFVNELFQTSYTCGESGVPASIQKKCGEAMEISEEEAASVFQAIGSLIKTVLFESITTKEGILAVLPDSLDDKLKKLVISAVASNLASWKSQTATGQLSLPQLKDFDWRIDIKTSADTVTRMSVPTALVQMRIEEIPTSVDALAQPRDVVFEASKDTIETMLDGMGKILEQMDSVTNR